MKTLLLLMVVLSGVLAVTAKAVEAVEPVEGTQELQEVNLVSVAESEAGEFVPEAEEPEMLSAGEMASSVKGRFFLCPTGWVRYRSSCYLYVSAGKSWSGAAAYCNSAGATLASAHNSFEYSFLQQLTSRGGGSRAWMGGIYFQGWRWVDQSVFDYSFWNAQHSVTSYPCIHLNTRVGWSNNYCRYGWPSICVRKTDDSC